MRLDAVLDAAAVRVGFRRRSARAYTRPLPHSDAHLLVVWLVGDKSAKADARGWLDHLWPNGREDLRRTRVPVLHLLLGRPDQALETIEAELRATQGPSFAREEYRGFARRLLAHAGLPPSEVVESSDEDTIEVSEAELEAVQERAAVLWKNRSLGRAVGLAAIEVLEGAPRETARRRREAPGK